MAKKKSKKKQKTPTNIRWIVLFLLGLGAVLFYAIMSSIVTDFTLEQKIWTLVGIGAFFLFIILIDRFTGLNLITKSDIRKIAR